MTAVMQSSTAAIAVTLSAYYAGAIGLDQGCALIIGQNIGTATSSALAAIGASSTAKRLALAYILFKLIGVRPELLPQLVSLYGSLPEPKITLSTPPLLVRVTKDTPSADAARSLIDRWTRSSRTTLAQAAKAALRRR